MTKKQKMKILIMTFVVVLIVGSLNFVMCRQLNSESDSIRVKNFYKLEKNSQDMILIGASTAYTDYSAPLAWKEFGYTSYSLATNMAPMGLAKSMLIEARKTQNPKVFVIDINGILYNDEQETREGGLRLWIDNMPNSKNKQNTINELVRKEDRLSYTIPFLKYHSNWYRLYECFTSTIDELFNSQSVYLSASGMQGNAKIDPQKNSMNIKDHKKTTRMFKLSSQHLTDLLEYCKSEKLTNVVFSNMPRYYSQKMIPERERNNAAKELIESYGYECLDMDDYVDEIGLDPLTDFYNPNHLNVYGQKKLTKYFGNLLNEKYQLSKSTHDSEVSQRYDKEYEAYQKVYAFADKQMKAGKNVRYNYDKVKTIIEK